MSRALVMITEPEASLADLERVVPAAVRGGVSHILLRTPRASASDLYESGTRLMALLEGSGIPLLVSDRVDVALALGAHGIHLGQRSLPVDRVRAFATNHPIGASVHDVEQARRAAGGGADYLFFGHVYATPSHPGEPERGVDALRKVIAAVDIPVIAIGGISAANAGEVIAAGATGVAVIRAISGAADPEAAARSLRRTIDRAGHPHLTPRKEHACS